MDISILDLEGEDCGKPQKMVIVEDDDYAAEGERDSKDGGVRDEVPTSTPSTGRRQPNPTPSPPPTLLVGKEQRAHLEGSMRATAVLAAMDELLPQVVGQGRLHLRSTSQKRIFSISGSALCLHVYSACTSYHQVSHPP